MKNKLLLISLCILFFTGCEDKKPDQREFPIIRTLTPTHVDASGATFCGELIQEGNTQTTSFGFIWSDVEPDINESNKIILGEVITSGTFEIRIDSAFVKGVEYKIKAFATYSDKTVYGNTISIFSKGCSKSSWSLELRRFPLKVINCSSYGNADNEYGYISFADSRNFIYDPVKNEISGTVKFPIETHSLYTSVIINKIQYFFTYLNTNLYKLENGAWSVQSIIPFNYGNFNGYYLGFAVSGKLYILSSYRSYMYDPDTDIWQSKAILSSGPGASSGGTVLNNKAYIITGGKAIWEYDINTDSWVYKTSFPGNIVSSGLVVSFSYNDKIYFGLSYTRFSDNLHSLSNMDRRLWSYDPVSNKWNILEGFPVTLSTGGLFYFFLKDNLYVGYHDMAGICDIWKFDPSLNN